MKPKLPRFMLWTDKTSMEEFLREPINKRLYYFYLDLNNIRCQIGPDNSALKLFNEIYYQLTRVEYEDNLNFKLDDYTQKIEDNIGKEYSILFVYKMFFAFLILRENNSNVARLFQSYVYYKYNRTWDERTNTALGSIIKEEKKYFVELRPHTCPIDSLEGEVPQWDEITNNFDPSSIKEMLNLWSSKEEKVSVLHMIEDEFKKIIRRPVAIKDGILHSILRVNQFFSNMYSELGGSDCASAMIAGQKKAKPTQVDVGHNPVEKENDEDKLPSITEMAAACEKTQEELLWWGNASWSVTYRIYCILGYKGRKESFINEVSGWPFKKPFKYICNRHSLSRPLRSGKISGPLEKWAASGALTREVKLGERLMEILSVNNKKCSIKWKKSRILPHKLHNCRINCL